jgi:DNA mismatch repair protein MutH
MLRAPPPSTLDELARRAERLSGLSLDSIAAAMGMDPPRAGLRTKGKTGELLERVLGATAGSSAEPDFPALGVELKTVPVQPDGRPRESTFVCAISLVGAEKATWSDAWARRKLSHVLFVPIAEDAEGSLRIVRPLFFRPTAEQDAILRSDFDQLMGAIGAGAIETLSAREGRFLQIRPKARDGTPTATAYGPEGEAIATVPRGFYLRARFVGAILRDPTACPE